MDYSLNRITDAASEPVTVTEAKDHLRVDGTTEDIYITGLISAARHAVEKIIGRPIGEQTWELGLRAWPSKIAIPQPPLLSITSIKYTPYGKSEVTVESSVYKFDTSGDPGELWLRATEMWPVDQLEDGFPIRVRYTCGIETVPSDLKQAMLLLMAHLYENREAVVFGGNNQPFEVPFAVKALCAPHTFEAFR